MNTMYFMKVNSLPKPFAHLLFNICCLFSKNTKTKIEQTNIIFV